MAPVSFPVLGFSVLALAAAGSSPAESAEPSVSYAGKQITIVVGLPPGGGADAYARLLQRHLGRHIPGNPNILVQNMPGAGSLRAVMYLNTTAPADGTVMATFNPGLITEAVTAPERVRMDFRNFRWIGNVSEDVRVCYVWGASGVKTWQDMTRREKPLFMGASAPGSFGDADVGMLQNLFGVKIRQVQGYGGSADKKLAIERREIEGECSGWTTLPEDWLRDKKINIILRLSPTLVAGLDTGVPFGGDLVKNERERRLYDFLIAPERLGRVFMVSNKVPAARLALLRAGFEQMVADPAFRSDAQRLKLPVVPMGGEEVARHIAEIYATPPDIVARAKTIIGN